MAQRESTKTKQPRSLETREKIVAVGKRMFCESGYHAVSSKRIAKEAGVATGTFYLHFNDKKSLLIEIYRRHMEQVHRELETYFETDPFASLDASDKRPLMKEIVTLVYRTHDLSPELHREISVLSQTDSDFAALDKEEKRRSHAKLGKVLSPHLNGMRVQDPAAAVFVISQAMEAVIHAVIMHKPPMAKKRLLDALADMLSRYLFE